MFIGPPQLWESHRPGGIPAKAFVPTIWGALLLRMGSPPTNGELSYKWGALLQIDPRNELGMCPSQNRPTEGKGKRFNLSMTLALPWLVQELPILARCTIDSIYAEIQRLEPSQKPTHRMKWICAHLAVSKMQMCTIGQYGAQQPSQSL